MPSVSKAQQRLMGAAEHGANFPMAKKLRESMTHQQLHDFASGPEKGKPVHVNAHKRSTPTEKPKTDSHPGLKYNHSTHASNHPNMRYK